MDALQTDESKRARGYERLESFGDFRGGSMSVSFSKGGKKHCLGHQPGHPGHGPRYLWSPTRKGKSVAQHVRVGPELEQARRQVETGRRFQAWCQEVVESNEPICRVRPVPELEDVKALERLQKNGAGST